jgi:hypothetical protein
MRIARSTGVVSGLLIAVLGIWGALAPFIGPYFDYSFGVNSTWHYTTDRLLLSILPGAAALVGGAMIARASSRPSGAFGAWLALLAGAWFAIGAALSRIWEHAASPIGGPLFGSTRQALELIGCFYGLGIVVVALAAFAAGRIISRPALAGRGDPYFAVERDPYPREPAAVGDPAVSPPADRVRVSSHPRRRTIGRRGARRRADAPPAEATRRDDTTTSTREL